MTKTAKEQLSIFEFKPQVEPEPKKQKQTALSLSYSQLDTYKTCPLKYKYQYVLKLPMEANSAASFGTTVHTSLQKFYEEVIQSKKPTLDRLLEIYRESWIPLGYSSPAHAARQKKEGEKMIAEFFRKYHRPNAAIIDMEKVFKIKITPELTINGKIDRVDAGGKNSIEIIDYKTGKTPGEKDLKNNIQLSIYLMAAMDPGLYRKKIDEVTLTFYYLQDAKEITMTRNEADLAKVKETIVDMAQKIMDEQFEPKVGKWCDFCAFRMICEAWQ
jgi:DNA helicase-2/ATP-dependent DNA helicase PcrA